MIIRLNNDILQYNEANATGLDPEVVHKQPSDQSVLYVTPNGTGYEVGVYTEEYPGGGEVVTGEAKKLSESEVESYIQDAKEPDAQGYGQVDKDDILPSVLQTLRRELPEDQAP